MGEVETIKSVIGNTALQRGVKGGTYIVQIGSWGHGRRLVYGRDIFEDDRFYTKVLFRMIYCDQQMNFLD